MTASPLPFDGTLFSPIRFLLQINDHEMKQPHCLIHRSSWKEVNRPKRGSSNTPTVDSVDIRSAKRAFQRSVRLRYRRLRGFRTVSELDFSHSRRIENSVG